VTQFADREHKAAVLRKIERRIRERCFEDQDATILGFASVLDPSWCRENPSACEAMAEVDPDRTISVWIGTDGPVGRFYKIGDGPRWIEEISNETVVTLERLQWICQEPLPPLVVLAKCAEESLPTDEED